MSKPAELREQTDEQLELLLKETQQNLFRLRLQSETERLEAPSEIIKAKREIARIKTILRLREIEPSTPRPPPRRNLEPTSEPDQTDPTGNPMSHEPTAAHDPTPGPHAAARRRSGS